MNLYLSLLLFYIVSRFFLSYILHNPRRSKQYLIYPNSWFNSLQYLSPVLQCTQGNVFKCRFRLNFHEHVRTIWESCQSGKMFNAVLTISYRQTKCFGVSGAVMEKSKNDTVIFDDVRNFFSVGTSNKQELEVAEKFEYLSDGKNQDS